MIRSRPFFVRIFVVMLLAVAVVQLMTSALLLLSGPPPEAIRTVDETVAALHREPGTYADFAVTVRADAPPGTAVPPFERLLAGRLAVPSDRVRVVQTARQPRNPLASTFDKALPHDTRAEIMMGRFEAAVRQTDGRWKTVTALRREFEAWRRDTLVWLLVSMLASAPFAWLLARWSTYPVKALADAAERIGRDDRAPPLELRGPREIVEAVTTFNAMQARIAQQLRDRSMLIASIAHDLRTPMMRLSLRLRDAPATYREAVERDVNEMKALVDAAIAYVAAETQPVDRRLLDLRSLIGSVVDDAADVGGAVTLHDGEPLQVAGNPVALRALVSNLVTNALKYGGSASLELFESGANAVLIVRDSGPGFTPLDLEKAFEPFYRGEASRNRDTGGFGLGLAAVRAIARAHGGSVEIANAPAGGATVTAKLLIARASEF